jgi:hypothetical protein
MPLRFGASNSISPIALASGVPLLLGALLIDRW